MRLLSLPIPSRRKTGRWSFWLDLFLALLGVACVVYAFIDLDQFIRRSTMPEPLDVFFGIAAILLLLELSRRVVDNTFTLVVVGFLLYVAISATYFPGIILAQGI